MTRDYPLIIDSIADAGNQVAQAVDHVGDKIALAIEEHAQAINRLVPPGAPVNTREQVNVVCEAIELIRNNHSAEAIGKLKAAFANPGPAPFPVAHVVRSGRYENGGGRSGIGPVKTEPHPPPRPSGPVEITRLHAAAFALPVNMVVFGLENLVFLLCPHRILAGSNMGPLALGRHMLLMFLKVMLLLIVAAMAAGVGGVAYRLCDSSRIAFWIGTWLAAVLLAIGLVPAVSWAYRRYDPSTDTPP